MTSTNMACLTPEGAMSGDCDFLSANLYARSLFGSSSYLLMCLHYTYNCLGEDALANLSIERTEEGTITGHVRIRSKTQGIALSLGDRITMSASLYLIPVCLYILNCHCSAKGRKDSCDIEMLACTGSLLFVVVLYFWKCAINAVKIRALEAAK
jgi:hypothetical protein